MADKVAAESSHCTDSVAPCQTDLVFVIDFVGGTEKCIKAFERQITAVQAGKNFL